MWDPEVFAREVVQKLNDAGFRAFWAGGCVRDRLMGWHPKDYDVATDAAPQQVRRVFGRRRTLMIGASFGVVAVVGPRPAPDQPPQQVEVATFRCEEGYSDGRHPDHVAYSTPEQDALRRDFTINGLFYDPHEEIVIDYVGGRVDLRRKRIRAIGDPSDRFGEDKLRMLRAVRFSTLLEFQIEPETYRAIQRHADELRVVSAERIAAELRRILMHSNAAEGVRLLRSTGLARVVLPEAAESVDCVTAAEQLLQCLHGGSQHDQNKGQASAAGKRPVREPIGFVEALAALLHPIIEQGSDSQTLVKTVAKRWKLTNRERDDTLWLLRHLETVLSADQVSWPQLQPTLIDARIGQLLTLARAVARYKWGETPHLAGIALCENKLSLPPSQLDPAPLLGGHDLKQLGIPASKQMGLLLAEVRRHQLLGRLTTRDEALRWVQQRRDLP